jgi:hypothetical protein
MNVPAEVAEEALEFEEVSGIARQSGLCLFFILPLL